MIWDCFPFAGELDVLDCRLAHLRHVPNLRHVIVEAAVDNHGRPKPLSIRDRVATANGARWLASHCDRIIYMTVHEVMGDGPWEREHAVRDEVIPLLRHQASFGDTVLIADADEIPAIHALTRRVTEPHTLLMRDIAITLNQAWPDRQPTSVVCPWGIIGYSISSVRDNRVKYPIIDEAGWHLSWLGGPEAVERKLAMHCHTRSELDERISKLRPNDDVPPWCRENAPASWWGKVGSL